MTPDSKQVKFPVADLLDATVDAQELLRTYTDGDFGAGGNPIALSQVAAPTAAPDRALGAAGVLNGTYYYTVSFVTAIGETEAYRPAQAASPVNQKVELSNIPIGPSGVTARKLYRNKDGGYEYKLLATINDNTTTNYSDNIADNVPTQFPTRRNTTGGYISVNDLCVMAADPAITLLGNGIGQTGSGEGNTLIGKGIGPGLTTGYWLTCVGQSACQEATTAFECTYVGFEAGKEAVSTWYCLGVGSGSLKAHTNGAQNSAGGAAALLNLTSGSSNSAWGFGSGQRLLTSNRTTVIGDVSANYQADGTTPLTFSSACVYVGAACRAGGADETNAIVIGADAIGLGSNTTVIGNLETLASRIFGDLKVGGTGVGKIELVRTNGSGTVQAKMQVIDDGSGNYYVQVSSDGTSYDITPLILNKSGSITILGSTWHKSSDGRNRFHFGADGPTYIRGAGTDPLIFSDGDGTNVLSYNTTTGWTMAGAMKFNHSIWHTSSDGKNRVYFGADGTTYIRGHGSEAIYLQDGDGTTNVKIDSSSTAGHTRFFVFDVDNNTLERVTVGAADSGGTGYKVLRIPN